MPEDDQRRPRRDNDRGARNERPSGGRPNYREGGQRREGGYNRDGGAPRREGGYSRDGGAPRREGGYSRDGGAPRRDGAPRREGGYSRDGGAPRREGGYSRDGGAPRREGGYNRDGGAPRREGGAPRREGGYNRDGAAPRRDGGAPRREGGYSRDGGAPRREGGYNRDGGAPRREGGYNRDGAAPRRDAGAPRREGGAPRREGGYNRDGGAPRREGGAPRREGGYSRDGGAPRREGGYNRDGGAPRREGGYSRDGAAPRREGGYDRTPRREGTGAGRSYPQRGGAGRDRPVQAANERPRFDEPQIPEEVTARDLNGAARNELKTLSKENAEHVARHLAMASRLIDEDPALAHEHALAASRSAGRIAIVRETLGITAYATEDFALALRELRTFRRISGKDDQIALMVDSERGIGRPDRALETGRAVDRSTLATPVRVALAIAMSGARLDQGDLELALGELEIPELDPDRAFEWSPALFAARAAVLEDLGRDDEAAFWTHRAEVAAEALGIDEAGDEEIFIEDGLIEGEFDDVEDAEDVSGSETAEGPDSEPADADDEPSVEDEVRELLDETDDDAETPGA
ncbi:primosomal protein [Microbacterium sp. NPDC090003]|uniref:primosomal protein n=1 Tax=Microbacterium sp. NPDC090003 TaxID=3364203 RepID=UPI0038023ED5